MTSSNGYEFGMGGAASPSSSAHLVREGHTIAARDPVPVILPPPLSLPELEGDRPRRPVTSPATPSPAFKTTWGVSPVPQRDSGLGTTVSTVSNGSYAPDDDGYSSPSKIVFAHESSTSLPAVVGGVAASPPGVNAGQVHGSCPSRYPVDGGKLRISMDIPSGHLFGDDVLDRMSFSKRGSILLGGRRAKERRLQHQRTNSSPLRHASSVPVPPTTFDGGRQMSPDEKLLSQQVRSLYEDGSSGGTKRHEAVQGRVLVKEVEGANGEPEIRLGIEQTALTDEAPPASRWHNPESPRSIDSRTLGTSDVEDAGGVEDWEDVDRYGFIIARRMSSRGLTSSSQQSPRILEPQGPQRVSTLLQLASETPRRNRGLVRKTSNPRMTRSGTPQRDERKISGGSARSSSSQKSNRSGHWRLPVHPLQYAASRLPGNKDKRSLIEAGDMLTLPPRRTKIAEADGELEKLKRKEWKRAEKWRKMAKVVTKRADGQGTVFDFDVRDPKLIARTWKGIPDRWRATAWYSFLSSSARKSKESPSDEDIVARFHALVEQGSADDVQIDMDVPRTINRHIMFRRRYRGGQRLLFRLLHCLSLYFPSTGYVQGMASLAATLLCYYDEDTAFVMLVRLWEVRGLKRLYEPGFQGLMDALHDLEKNWLGGTAVAKRLDDLGVDQTAYGTRWYLTLFNYSIPFAAQLRVWDVFMLLGESITINNGDDDTRAREVVGSSISSSGGGDNGELDVLHATSTALIDGMTEILLRSDFENAMKVLTSWIPIRDEDLLMKVVRAEWKRRGGVGGGRRRRHHRRVSGEKTVEEKGGGMIDA